MDRRGNRLIRRRRMYWLRASYTVEASYIIAITLVSLALLISTAYYRCRKETGIMRLHHMVELERGQWREEIRQFRVWGADGYSQRKKDTAEGVIRGEDWEKEIAAGIHRPEAYMRMLTIFQKDGAGGQEDDGVG